MTDETPTTDTPPEHSTLSHVRADGAVHMVDVGQKPVTDRLARAAATVRTTAEVVGLISAGGLPKGEALSTARIAGILGAKQTPNLIPLCHPLPLSAITIDLRTEENRVEIEATVKTRGVTGVEMEALTAASITALTVFDMIKAVDPHAVIADIHVHEKRGGKSDRTAP